jgi:hypothetical protein
MASKFAQVNPDSGYTYLADRVQTPKKSNNYLIDSKNEGRTMQFKKIVSECELDPENISPLFDCLEKRQREMLREMMASEELAKHSPIGRWDDDFLFDWIVHVSDADRTLLFKACERDEDTPKLLRMLGTQLHDSLVYAKDGKHKKVAVAVLNHHHNKMGLALATICRDGVIQPDGKLDFSKCCYTLDFTTEERAVSVTHTRSKVVVVIPEHVVITKNHQVQHNYSDWMASAALPPLDPIPFHQFFKSDASGPYKNTRMAGQVKEFNDHVKQTASAMGLAPAVGTASGVQTSSSSSSAPAAKATAKSAVAKAKAEKRKVSMAKARESAKEALKTKKQKNSVAASALQK